MIFTFRSPHVEVIKKCKGYSFSKVIETGWKKSYPDQCPCAACKIIISVETFAINEKYGII